MTQLLTMTTTHGFPSLAGVPVPAEHVAAVGAGEDVAVAPPRRLLDHRPHVPDRRDGNF